MVVGICQAVNGRRAAKEKLYRNLKIKSENITMSHSSQNIKLRLFTIVGRWSWCLFTIILNLMDPRINCVSLYIQVEK